MAHILDEGFVAKSYKSVLAKADFWRQRDVLVLAQRGDRKCQRLWNDFAESDPGMARLVVADVEHDRQESNKATAFVDEVLTKAEKPSKRPKVTKAAKSGRSSAGVREQAIREAEADLRHHDPARREAAWAALRVLR